MFENIIGHDRPISLLSEEIRSKNLPQVMLFYGPQFSGKLTVALELVRILGCEKMTAEWSCTCKGCVLNRTMLHPNVAVLGSRYFTLEIAACSDVLKKNPKESSRYLFIRSVRKLTRRFDPFIWEGEESRLQKIRSSILKLEELLLEISPGKELLESHQIIDLLDQILPLSEKISSTIATKNIPIFQIRNIRSWSHITSSDAPKIVLFENAEKMQESSRNALLKILEEPPKNVYFILIAQRKQEIIPTILSRLRPYHFMERSTDYSNQVMTRVFREEDGKYKRLHDYFLAFQNIQPGKLHDLVTEFISSIIKKEDFTSESKAEIQELAKKKGGFTLFLYELTEMLRKLLLGEDQYNPGNKISVGRIDNWRNLINDAQKNYEQYNINAVLLMESLYYRMLES
jgi:DNA polymerase III delta prime subunit